MIKLENGCSYSPLKVVPKNWKFANAPLNRTWYIYYRFKDPNHLAQWPKGKLKIIKSGLNEIRSLQERRQGVSALIKNEVDLLENKGYNPILNKCINITGFGDYIIHPATGFVEALKLAGKRLDKAESTMSDISSILNGVEKAARGLNMENLAISSIKRRHVISILDYCKETNPRFSSNRYNKYKAYLGMLFKELKKIETIEESPTNEIEKKIVTRKIRTLLNMNEREKINNTLRENNYPFWRFMQIFFHSGAREAELMKIQKKDVNINDGYFIITVNKRGVPTQEKRPIKNSVLHLWKELVFEAEHQDFIFGKGLLPAKVGISERQITRRWKTHVKDKLGIEADFYSLKHLNLDETAELLSISDAAKLAGHQSTRTTEKHYAINEEERFRKKIQELDNSFA